MPAVLSVRRWEMPPAVSPPRGSCEGSPQCGRDLETGLRSRRGGMVPFVPRSLSSPTWRMGTRTSLVSRRNSCEGRNEFKRQAVRGRRVMRKSAGVAESPWSRYLRQPIRGPPVTLVKTCQWEQLAHVFSPAWGGSPTEQGCEDVAKKKKVSSHTSRVRSRIGCWFSRPCCPRGPSPHQKS